MSKLSAYQARSKKKNLKFVLSKENFKKLEISQCLYCGIKFENNTNGIDRIDNNEGYTDTNSAACCWTCNRAKGTMTAKEFTDWVKRVYEHSYYFMYTPDDNEKAFTDYYTSLSKSCLLPFENMEQYAISNFVKLTKSITNLDNEILNKILKNCKNDEYYKEYLTKWVYGISHYTASESMKGFEKIIKLPNYLENIPKTMNPLFLEKLFGCTNFSKKEMKQLLNYKVLYIYDERT